MKRYYFPLLLAVSLSVEAQPLETFTLEDVLSSPFPADLVAAADEGAFAWTQNDRGRRSLWVARAPGYRAGAIFRDEKDEGQELTQVRFGPRATHVVFVRGGAPNRTGEIPNPASDPGGAAQGVEYEELVFPDDVHDFLLHENWLRAFEASADFLDRKLGSRPPTTNEP